MLRPVFVYFLQPVFFGCTAGGAVWYDQPMQFLKTLFSKQKTPPAAVFRPDDGHLIYAVGDIHGRVDLLDRLLDMLAADHQVRWGADRCTLVFLGDYVDRGFHSKQVLDRLLGLSLDWADVVCLKGNHEDMMLDFMLDPVTNEAWLHYGGLATLASYGVTLQDNAETGMPDSVKASKDLQAALPDQHFLFLRDAPLSYRSGDYFFVHAGIRPGVPLNAQDPHDMTFIRQDFTDSTKDHGVRVVHGHTGVQNPLLLPNRIAVDTIAYATGRLTAAAIQDDTVDFITT